MQNLEQNNTMENNVNFYTLTEALAKIMADTNLAAFNYNSINSQKDYIWYDSNKQSVKWNNGDNFVVNPFYNKWRISEKPCNINCTPISNLYIDEISIGDIFKYNNKFYVCRIGSGCTKCSFNDSINYRCTCEDGILTNCATALRHDNKPVYYVEIENPTLNGDNNQKYIDLDKKNIVGEGNPIVKEENNQQKNLVDIDKFLSKINDFEKEREKLCVLKEKFANLDKRPISKINSITISYRPTEYTVNEREHEIELTNGLIDEKLLREITDFAVQKMKEYENSLENEIKNIILN